MRRFKDRRSKPLFSRLRLWLALCLLALSFPARAQQDLKTAEAYFRNYEYALAVKAYHHVLEKKEPTAAITSRIADCYRLMNNYREAEFWYAQAVNFPEADAQWLKYYADAARRNGNYHKAKQLYLTYAEMKPEEEGPTLRLISTCENAQAWLARPEKYEVTRVESLSSEKSDFSPVFYGQGLVFTSDRPQPGTANKKALSGWTGNPGARLYYAQGDGSSWSAAEALPAPLNAGFQNGSAVFSPDGQKVFFTRINQVRVSRRSINNDPFSWVKFSRESNYVNRLEIFLAGKDGTQWQSPQPFVYNRVQEYSVGHPALSPDGQVLYFVSDMPGGYGETDLYYSRLQTDGSWSKPENLGAGVNTPGKEMFPTMAPDGTLYFSSEGHSGMGGLDIFASQGEGNSWKPVRNLRYPLNSPQDDFGFISDATGEAGYLSSNRGSADGSDDIFAFRYVRVPCQLAGRTVEKVQVRPGVFKEVAVGKVLVQLFRQGDTTALTTYSDAAGNFTFHILDGITYRIKGNKTGYLTRSAQVTPTCESVVDMVKMDMVLNRSTLNQPIVIENIYYDLDKWDIRPDAANELDKLVQTLKDNPGIRIELSSHTDSRHNHSYNNLLSQLRAEAAVTYIVSKGIEPARLVARGYGETRLLNQCADGVACPEADHQLNRRTEFKLLRVGPESKTGI